MQTIQPRDTQSLSHHHQQEDDDIYPYNMNPSPHISKPTHVGGLSTSDIDLGGVQRKNTSALADLVRQTNSNEGEQPTPQQPHVTMRKHLTQVRKNEVISGNYIKEENYEDDD